MAAVLLEPIQGEGGRDRALVGLPAAVRALCDERGILLMADEVQTGLGRTGRWFGFQHTAVVPDVVTMAKALGNGMPDRRLLGHGRGGGGLRSRGPRLHLRRPAPGGGGAAATLAVMEAEDVPARATRAGARLAAALEKVDGIESVRGHGLLLGAALSAGGVADGVVAADLAAAALAAGLIVNAPRPDTIRLAPSLLVTDEEMDEAVAILTGVLATVLAGARSDAPLPRHRRPLVPRARDGAGAGGPAGLDGAPAASGTGGGARVPEAVAADAELTELAVLALGGHPVYIQAAEVGIDSREPAEDVARTLACYHAVICGRVLDHQILVRMAAALDGGAGTGSGAGGADQIATVGHWKGFASAHDLGDQAIATALLHLNPGVAGEAQHHPRRAIGVSRKSQGSRLVVPAREPRRDGHCDRRGRGAARN